MSAEEPAAETPEAKVARLRAEVAELRQQIERRDGELMVLRHRVEELQQQRAARRMLKPMPVHLAGNA